jgi:putative addiction module CopG family antidote
MTVTLDLPPQLERFIRDEIAAGRYVDEAEVVRDALRRLHDFRLSTADGLEEVRAALQSGLQDVAAENFAVGGVMDAANRARR